MITATISNINREETNVRVFATLSDNSERSYLLPIDQATEESITSLIKADVDAANALAEKRAEDARQAEITATLLQALQGKVIA